MRDSEERAISNKDRYTTTGLFSLEEIFFGKMKNFIVFGREPVLKMSGLALPDAIAEVAHNKFIFPYEPGISRKYHVG
jgi:hypothetical protein